MSPAGGIGALVAMHDAVTLANWISTLQIPAISDLEEIFKEYKAEQYPIAKEALKRSQFFTKAVGKVNAGKKKKKKDHTLMSSHD